MLPGALALLTQIMLGPEVMCQGRVGRVVVVPPVRVAEVAVQVFLAQVAVQLVGVHEAFFTELAEGVASGGVLGGVSKYYLRTPSYTRIILMDNEGRQRYYREQGQINFK